MFSFSKSQQNVPLNPIIRGALKNNDDKADVVKSIHPEILESYDSAREDEGPVSEALDFVGDLTQFPFSYIPLGESRLTTECLAAVVKFMYMRRQFKETTSEDRKDILRLKMNQELFTLCENAMGLMAETQSNTK